MGTFPQHQRAFAAIRLPTSKGTPFPSLLTRCLELRLCLCGGMGGQWNRRRRQRPGSAVALCEDAVCLSYWDLCGTAAERLQKLVWRTRRKEPAGRRCLSSWKEEAGRRGMHLVLRCMCVKQLLEQRGAVKTPVWESFPN